MDTAKAADRRVDRRAVLKAAAGVLPLNSAIAGSLEEEGSGASIEGYVYPLSLEAGDKVRLHVSTSASRYFVEIARVGATRNVVFQRENLPGSEHPVPPDASTHGCRWPVALEFEQASTAKRMALTGAGNQSEYKSLGVPKSCTKSPYLLDASIRGTGISH